MADLRAEVINGPGIRLRPYREDDIPDVVTACNDPETLRFLHNLPNPYRLEDAAWWVAVGAPAGWERGGATFAVADPDTDRLIGSVGLAFATRERSQAEVGYWVSPGHRGRGVATAATRTIAGWGHRQGFARLELLCEPENVASQRVALAAGFRYEGVRRGAGTDRDGSRHDLTAWSRLAADPPGPIARALPDLPGGSLTDGVVTLRPLVAGDAADSYRLRSVPDIVATSVPPVPPDRAAASARCARAASHWLAGERADLVITDAVTGRFAGAMGLYHPQPVIGEAMIGYSVSPEHRGRGFAGRSVRLLAGWAFERVGLVRLTAGTDPTNHASQRVLERAGFRLEGYQRGALPGAGGGRTDVLIFGLVAENLTRSG